jgi:hypothetical protein
MFNDPLKPFEHLEKWIIGRGWDMLGSLKCIKIAKTNPICLGFLSYCFPGHLEVLGIDIFEHLLRTDHQLTGTVIGTISV